MVDKKILADPSLLIILATSPTGLGHLRVADALSHGLPKNASPVLLGAQDPTTSSLYRFISANHLTRSLMEKTQAPPFEEPFAAFSRWYLRSRTDYLYEKLRSLLGERLVVPKIMLFVIPHAILAHQFGPIKKRFEKETGVRSFLIVQVTDDSPQPVWYVPDADLLFVPSLYTKNHLLSYAKKVGLPEVPIQVSSYPMSPLLSEDATETSYTNRVEQLTPHTTIPLHMSVPVSGAAVGTSYLLEYLSAVHALLPSVIFHIVVKDVPYTKQFIDAVQALSYVKLSLSSHDRTTVSNYEQVFTEFHPSLEVTKPSEQAFKALLLPKQKGGIILLFAKPVGRQEYDNLHFLRTHGLLPHEHENIRMWEMALKKEANSEELLRKSHHWRALILPEKPEDAAIFTAWCREQGIFKSMMAYKRLLDQENLKPDGVDQFWTKVAGLVEENKEYLA